MEKYIVRKEIKLSTGLIGLTDDQAKARALNIMPVEGSDGVYEILAPIQFKVGEIIRLNSDSVPPPFNPLEKITEDD